MIKFIINIIEGIGDIIVTIKELVSAAIEIIDLIFIFIPEPYKSMTLAFITIAIGIIIYKAVKK